MNTTQLLKLEETILSLSLEEKKELFQEEETYVDLRNPTK